MFDCTYKFTNFILHKKKKYTSKDNNNFKKNNSMTDILADKNCKIVVYPDSDLKEVYQIMNCMKLEKLPVVQNPWNKKFLGYYITKKNIEDANIA
ncbi:MAG: CBS domain-containing protein [Candidatus Gastranaerophilales bacterium]|nr:CBS domain-containing protein [Candidatus Gastranaerophilales bacterium]